MALENPKAEWIAAMVAVQSEAVLPKDSIAKIPGKGSYKYISLPFALDTLRPILSRHGIAVWWSSVMDEHATMTMTCYVGHRSGHVEQATVGMPATWQVMPNNGKVPTGSPAIQCLGAAITYLQRYSLMQAMGLSAAEDTDGVPPTPTAQRQQTAPPPAQPQQRAQVVAAADELISEESLNQLRMAALRCPKPVMYEVMRRVEEVYKVPMQELMQSEAQVVHGWFLEAWQQSATQPSAQ